MNVLRWCPFAHLFDTPFQNPPYGHALIFLFPPNNTHFVMQLAHSGFLILFQYRNEGLDDLHRPVTQFFHFQYGQTGCN